MWSPDFPLMAFQKRGVDFIERHESVLIGDSMGLGKTAQAIAYADRCNATTLVICPAFLRLNWFAEIKKFLPRTRARFTIQSYDELKKERPGYFAEFDLVVADEAHYLANLKAQRTALFHAHAKTPPAALVLLTGTPIKNRVAEFYSPLLLLSKHPTTKNGLKLHRHFTSETHFCEHFSKSRMMRIPTRRGGFIEVKKYFGLQNVGELKEQLKKKYIRRLADDVLELPDLIYKTVEVDIKALVAMGDELMEDFTSGNNLSSSKAVSAAYKAPVTVKYVSEIVDEVGPCVVFTAHLESCKALFTALGSRYRVRIITGETNVSKRQGFVDEFQAGKVDVLCATIDSAGTGYNMTRASNIVFNDLSWVPGSNLQAVKRIHRIGQENKCVIHSIVGSDVDKYILKTLSEKQKVLDATL